MSQISQNLKAVLHELGTGVKLVAVSKTHPKEAILEAYHAGQRAFGENRVQEMTSKQPWLPTDIEWHLIGHLQTNKVKYIAPFVSMIQSVDSLRLLEEISAQAVRNRRVIDCLLQIFIAAEETKFGLDESELIDMLEHTSVDSLPGINIRGLMGMGSFTEDANQIRKEFAGLKDLFDRVKAHYFPDNPAFDQLSMGMSGDYRIAMEEGSTIVRIGTRIFGAR